MDSAELQALYARMNEGELEVVANEAYDLTEIARPLLQEEIVKRGLNIQLKTVRTMRKVTLPVASKHDLATVGTCWDLDEARKVKEFLDVSGVPSYWGPDHVDSLEQLTSSFDQGIEVAVIEDDNSRIQFGFSRLFSSRAEEAEAGDCNFACPKCHSTEIVFQELDATAKFNWSCDACGHQWTDDGVESEA